MLQTQLGHHPIALHFFPTGQIAFAPLYDFGYTLVDNSEGLEVYITPVNITIIDIDSREEMVYTLHSLIDYKKEPLLLQWLKSFNL